MRKWILAVMGSVLIVSCVPLKNLKTATLEPTISFTPENTPTTIPTVNSELSGYTSTSLEIVRDGKKYSVLLGYQTGEAFWRVTPHPDVNMFNWYGGVRQTSSANLEWYGDFDHDGEMEYLVSSYSVGNTLYVSILAIDYDSIRDEYRVYDEMGFRATSIDRWDDIENDGIPEIVAKDENYASVFSASVFAPLKIFHYDGAKFIGVTQTYPELIEKDAEHWLEMINNDALGQGQFDSIFSSYLADMYLLERSVEGVRVFLDLCESRYIPHIKMYNPDSTLRCADFLIQVQNRLVEYD